ncbi:hypothetical protein [Maioricimonas sp. JC845]|uniref:hypothetical protein n=1 Tax=Maioricimonas sp. JC845 TaxID=3232138 RepID=UPI003459C65C
MADQHPINRRAVLATLGGAALATSASPGVLPGETGDSTAPAVDKALMATRDGRLGGYMFLDQATSKVDPKRDLLITSARVPSGESLPVRIRPATMSVFRVDTTVDDFTGEGGWYWTNGQTEGKTRFESGRTPLINTPPGGGPLVMVVYQADGTVHWYSLQIDLRC